MSGNGRAWEIVRKFPGKYICFANEVPGQPETRRVIEKYLKLDARGIGEQKFAVDVTGREMAEIFDIAQDYAVPVLLHFQHEKYSLNFEQFHRVLARYPRVNFIGHAQTWWGNIDVKHDQAALYPKGRVTAGGLTDRWLSDYPNLFADLSAASGLNAMQRDEVHAREFIERHQDRLLYGSDCSDHAGGGGKCSGSQQLGTLKRLAPLEIQKKLFWENAARVINVV